MSPMSSFHVAIWFKHLMVASTGLFYREGGPGPRTCLCAPSDLLSSQRRPSQLDATSDGSLGRSSNPSRGSCQWHDSSTVFSWCFSRREISSR